MGPEWERALRRRGPDVALLLLVELAFEANDFLFCFRTLQTIKP